MVEERKEAAAATTEELLDFEPDLAGAVSSWLGGIKGAVAPDSDIGRIEHVGRIVRVADGVATVAGLPRARLNELLLFPGRVYGTAFNLDIEVIGLSLIHI